MFTFCGYDPEINIQSRCVNHSLIQHDKVMVLVVSMFMFFMEYRLYLNARAAHIFDLGRSHLFNFDFITSLEYNLQRGALSKGLHFWPLMNVALCMAISLKHLGRFNSCCK